MHALHCLLVSLDKWQIDEMLASQNNPQRLQEIEMRIRLVAMEATSEYADQAFDWRSEDDAGSWIDDFPGAGVVLGAKESERFKELLAEYSQKPLKRAMVLMEKYDCYAGRILNKSLLREVWANKKPWDEPWTLATIFRLLIGDYLFESQFYSVPDASAKISDGVFRDAMEHPEYYALVFSDYHW
ncbi:hypothetical protein SDD30_16830 [Moorella naiadis]|uniref:hypothetical protein n=1 Tax=Moorella naiadis (nom. illeg.) TaxID=3093670 RepID=UPI003D9CB013